MNTNETSKSVNYNFLKQYLNMKDSTYKEDTDSSILYLDLFLSDNIKIANTLKIDNERNLIILTCEMPLMVSDLKTSEVIFLLTSINCLYNFGHFAMEISTGQIEYRISSLISEGILKDETISRLLSIGTVRCLYQFEVLHLFLTNIITFDECFHRIHEDLSID